MRGSAGMKSFYRTLCREEMSSSIPTRTATGNAWWLLVCCRNAVSLQNACPPRVCRRGETGYRFTPLDSWLPFLPLFLRLHLASLFLHTYT